MTPALSHAAHEGRRWSQRFLRMRQRLHALTLRKELEADEGAVVGDAGFTVDADESAGEGLSASRADSSKERLMPVIRAHGRFPVVWS